MKKELKQKIKIAYSISQSTIILAALITLSVYWWKLAINVNKIPSQGWIISAIVALSLLALFYLQNAIKDLVTNIQLSEEYYIKKSGLSKEEYQNNLINCAIRLSEKLILKQNITLSELNKKYQMNVDQYQMNVDQFKKGKISKEQFLQIIHDIKINQDKIKKRTIIFTLLCCILLSLFLIANILFLTKIINSSTLITINRLFTGIAAIPVIIFSLIALISTILITVMIILLICISKNLSNEFNIKLPQYSEKLCAILEMKTKDLSSLTKGEIDKTFRALSLKYHPDKNHDKSNQEKQLAEEKFKAVNEASIELKDYLAIRDSNFFIKLRFICYSKINREENNLFNLDKERIEKILGAESIVFELFSIPKQTPPTNINTDSFTKNSSLLTFK